MSVPQGLNQHFHQKSLFKSILYGNEKFDVQKIMEPCRRLRYILEFAGNSMFAGFYSIVLLWGTLNSQSQDLESLQILCLKIIVGENYCGMICSRQNWTQKKVGLKRLIHPIHFKMFPVNHQNDYRDLTYCKTGE